MDYAKLEDAIQLFDIRHPGDRYSDEMRIILDAARETLARREKEKPRVSLEKMVRACELEASSLSDSFKDTRTCLKAAADLLRRLQEFKAHAISKDNEGYYCNVRCFEFLRSFE